MVAMAVKRGYSIIVIVRMHEIGLITTFQIVYLAYRLPKLNISSLGFEEERNKIVLSKK